MFLCEELSKDCSEGILRAKLWAYFITQEDSQLSLSAGDYYCARRNSQKCKIFDILQRVTTFKGLTGCFIAKKTSFPLRRAVHATNYQIF